MIQIKNNGFLEKLKKAGFTDKEALVYLSVLELGGAYPSKITEYCGLNRSTIYKILTDLSIRGLVNEIEKKNKLYYQIEKPDHIVRYTKNKIALATEQLEQVEKLIPEFEGLYSLLSNKPKVLYFENQDGIVAIYRDMLDIGKKYEMLAFSNAAEIEHVFPKKFFEEFRRTKEKLGITTRGIIPDTKADRTYNERFFAGYKKEVVPQIRFVPAEKFPFKGEITIYGTNKVAVVNLNKEYLTGIIIEDETIHNMMRMIFELSWKGTEN